MPPIKKAPAKQASKKMANTVKQTFHTSREFNLRILRYKKATGIKQSQVLFIAVNNFLTNNNY